MRAHSDNIRIVNHFTRVNPTRMVIGHAMLLANQALTLHPSPNRRFAARRGTSKSVFLPFSQRSVREKGPGDEGKITLKSIDQQHL